MVTVGTGAETVLGAETAADIEPVFVRPLLPQVERERNDSNPAWMPGGEALAFERTEGARREIVVARLDGTVVKKIYYQANADDLGLGDLLPSLGASASYNSGLAWSTTGDRFVFMSNAGEGNYDLYLGTLANNPPQRLTHDPAKDGQPQWSPKGSEVVFVSGRSGGAQLFVMAMDTQQVRPVSAGDKAYLYPRWSPDGKRIAAIYGANENHDVVVIDNVADAAASHRQLTTWGYDDLSPSWSPDGKRIAFYTNYNEDNDPKVWSIVVVEATGSAPTGGEGLIARVVARSVVPDVSIGPAWAPDSRRIAYVHDDKDDYSPIYIVDVQTKQARRLRTGTDINHDLSFSAKGVLAFRAQVDQWDQIYLAGIDE